MTKSGSPVVIGLLSVAALLALSLSLLAGAQLHAPGAGGLGNCPLPPAFALPGPPHALQPGGMPLPFDIARADLSEAQQDQLFGLLHEQAPRRRAAQKEVFRARKALHQLVRVEPFDQTAAQLLSTAQGEAVARLAMLDSTLEVALRAVLTPAQRSMPDSQPSCPARP